MSKKTRKKSPKAPVGKPRAKTTSKPKKATSTPKKTSTKLASPSAKTASAKTTKATAKKSATSASKKTGNAPAKASHKAPSKPLKAKSHSESVAPVVTASNAPAPKPLVVMPPADRSPAPKAVTPAPRQIGLSEGAKAPAFRLPRDGGDSVSLSDFKGRKLVLFFYPRADTPGCTKEAIDFSRLSAAFAEHQTAVLGVSADPLKAQEAFRDKHELVTPLVSDEQHEMLDAYGVWGEKSMYGRTFLGILRTTVLVGADGRIIRIWRNVKVDGHADEVLAAVRAL
jgi:peroxiredoxin Q/BCP